MTAPKNDDREIERHFMRALKVAITDRGLNMTEAEALAGLAPGTMSLWLRGQRMPKVLRFAQVADALGLDPGALINDGYRRAREAGALADVDTIPAP